MHACVIRYDVRPGQAAERVRHAREGRGAALTQAPGLTGRVILVDPASNKQLTLALFDSEANMNALETNAEYRPAFGQHEHAAGDVTVEMFEVAHQEGSVGKHARVVTLQVKPGRIDDRLQQLRSIEEFPGRSGLLSLIERASHKNLTISFWDSENAMRAFEREEGTRVGANHHRHGGDVVLEHFEVGHSDVPVQH
jgi:heme-degrading monooxygenase HmoA